MTHFDYNKKNNFRICQMTDMHLDTTERLDEYAQALYLIRKTVKETKPDLVVVTGDLAWGQGTEKALQELAGVFDELNMPWAPVLGNHDGNACDSEIKTREDFADILLGFGGKCLFEKGDSAVHGNGNYTISIGKNADDPEWVLFLMDSHQGDFYLSQINWYAQTSSQYPAAHKELAFFHVPVPEYLEVWNYETCKGYNMENICSTHMNDGLFSAMVRAGAMKGIFVGHDHINDFEGTLNGIRLCYGRWSGYQCYGMENFLKGARLIDLKAGEDDFKTSIYLSDGTIYEQSHLHRPKLRRK